MTRRSADLPGAETLDKVLVKRAIDEVNRAAEVGGMEGSMAVAEVVLDAFFGGRVSLFRSTSKCHASYRELLEDDRLQPSSSFIWHAIAVREQLGCLPSEARGALPMSHHRLLLPVRDRRLKRRLARKALQQGLSKRELTALIRSIDVPRDRSRGGRPRLPAVAKALGQLPKLAELATSEPLGPELFDEYSAEEAKELLADTYAAMDALLSMVEGLRTRVAAHEGMPELRTVASAVKMDAAAAIAAK